MKDVNRNCIKLHSSELCDESMPNPADFGVLHIKFVGTHAEYDRIDPEPCKGYSAHQDRTGLRQAA